MWAAVNADSEESRSAEQDPSSVQKKKMIYQGQNLGHGKFPVFMLFFFFLNSPRTEGSLSFCGGGVGGKATIQLINLVN